VIEGIGVVEGIGVMKGILVNKGKMDRNYRFIDISGIKIFEV